MPFSKFEVVPETFGEPCFQKGSLVSGLLRLAGAKLFSEIMKDWVTRMLPIGWFAEILTGVGLRTSLGLWGSRGPTLIWVDQCVSVPYSHCGTALKGEVGGGSACFVPDGTSSSLHHCHLPLPQAQGHKSDSSLGVLAYLLEGFLEVYCSAVLIGLSTPFLFQVGL